MRKGKILLISLLIISSFPFILWFSRSLWLLPVSQQLLTQIQAEQPPKAPIISLQAIEFSSPTHIQRLDAHISGIGDVSLSSVRFWPEKQSLQIQRIILSGRLLALADKNSTSSDGQEYSLDIFQSIEKLKQAIGRLGQQLPEWIDQLNDGAEMLGLTEVSIEQVQVSDVTQPMLPVVLSMQLKQSVQDVLSVVSSDSLKSARQDIRAERPVAAAKEKGWQLIGQLQQPVQAQLEFSVASGFLDTALQITPEKISEAWLAQWDNWLKTSPLQHFPIKDELLKPGLWQQSQLRWSTELDLTVDASVQAEQTLLAGKLAVALPQKSLPLKDSCQLALQPLESNENNSADNTQAQNRPTTFHLAYQLNNSQLRLIPGLPNIKYQGDCLNTWLKPEQKVITNRGGELRLTATHWLLDLNSLSVSTDSMAALAKFSPQLCKNCVRQPIQPKLLAIKLNQLDWQLENNTLQTGLDVALKGRYFYQPQPKEQRQVEKAGKGGELAGSDLPTQNLSLDASLSGKLQLNNQKLSFNGWGAKALKLKVAELLLPGERSLLGSELSLKPKVALDISSGQWQLKAPWRWQGEVRDPLLKQAQQLEFMGQISADSERQKLSAHSQLSWLPVALQLTHRLPVKQSPLQPDVLSSPAVESKALLSSGSAGVQVLDVQSLAQGKVSRGQKDEQPEDQEVNPTQLDFDFHSTQPIPLSELADKLHLPKELELKAGSIELQANGSGAVDNLLLQGQADIQQLSGEYQGFQLTDLAVPLTIMGQYGPQGLTGELKPTEVIISQAFTGVELTDIQFDLQGGLDQSGPYGALSDLTANLFDGSLGLDQLAYPLKGQSSLLMLKNLDLQTLVDLDESQQISITGRISGQMPLVFFSDGVEVQQGLIYANVPGEINLSKNTAWRAMLQQNEALSASLKHLNRLHYSVMEGELDMTRQGQLRMKMKIQGENRAERQPINLNFTSEQNIFTLLKALRLSEQISRSLDQSIQRKY